MGYSIYIERESEISLEEWRDAANRIEGVRIDESPLEMKNPKTGEVIKIEGSEGDIAVRFLEKIMLGFKKNEFWQKAISFSNGRGQLNYHENLENSKDPIRKALSSLASELSATIRGEEGEEYDW